MLDKKNYKINDDISKAKTLHSDYYTSDDIFNDSIDKIFSTSWQLVSHQKEFNKNNIMPIELLPDSISEPLIITKNNNKIHCISNVCTHRGHLVCDKSKEAYLLSCRYHGRTFQLDGKLKNAIGFEGVKKFPSKKDNLKQLGTKIWNDFIFISLNKGIDISEILNDIETRLKKFPFEAINYSKELSSEYIVDAHWALYCENYLEGLHVPFVHKGLSKEINNNTYKTIISNNGVLQYAQSADHKEGVYGYYYWIFPNLMLNFYSWGLSVNIIEPISKDKTRVRFLSYPIKTDKATKNAIKELNTIELEDQEVVKSVQRGIKSRYYKSGRYSIVHERGVHYFHMLLSRYL